MKAPTLVMHSRNDLRIPFDSGKELAGGIPGARFVAIESSNHIIPEGDPAWPRQIEEINAFLSG